MNCLRNNIRVGSARMKIVRLGQVLGHLGEKKCPNLLQILPLAASRRWASSGYTQAEDEVKADQKTNKSKSLESIQLENKRILAKLLGIDCSEVTKVPFKLIHEEKAKVSLEVLKNFKFTLSSVRLYPELLLMSGGAMENYIRIMDETGFPEIREMFIVRFRTVCKQSLSVLQTKMGIPSVEVIVERYCTQMQQDDEFRKSCMDNLPRITDKVTLYELRNDMMCRYLSRILDASNEENTGIFATYPRMYYRCFDWVQRNYQILSGLGFSKEKIRNHSYLLHMDPNQMSRLLTIPSLGGLEMNKICSQRPKILTSSYETLTEIEASLIEHGISFDSVQKYPEIYTLSAGTIRDRLQEMDTIPEFQLFKTHPRVARLLYYHNKAKARLAEFQSMEIRAPSLHLLSTDTKRFNKTVQLGSFRVRGLDIAFYLADVLQVDRKRVRDSLSRHPHWLHISLVSITSVLKLLQSVSAFSTEQIVDALPILLYPEEKVAREIDNVIVSGDARLEDKFFLQMVLYYLERLQHFSGDGVWNEKSQLPDDEDEESSKVTLPEGN